MSVAYAGRSPGNPVYLCNRRQLQLGLDRCLRFGGARVDAAIADEILRVVEPLAVDASLKAERVQVEGLNEQQRAAELDLQQARYEASLAERRYAACDPDNRLIAAELEKSWEVTLRRIQACEARLETTRSPSPQPTGPDLTGLADDLKAAWNAPGVSMRARQRLVRTLIAGVVADVDEEAREVLLTIHWVGGRHSRLRVRKPRSGEHGCRTPEEALGVIRSMAGRWSDEHIAASLNRMGMRTGQDKSWTGNRVGSIRRVNGIDGYLSADKQGDWYTMTQAGERVGHHQPYSQAPHRGWNATRHADRSPSALADQSRGPPFRERCPSPGTEERPASRFMPGSDVNVVRPLKKGCRMTPSSRSASSRVRSACCRSPGSRVRDRA